MGVWSNLHSDLLLSILKHTTSKDHVVLKAVCTHWGIVLKENMSPPPSELSWLLVPKQDPYCGFYSISQHKFYEISLPEAYVQRCCGSSEGWLIMCGKTPLLFMLNPFTRSRIDLPPVTTFPQVLEFCPYDVGKEYKCQLDKSGFVETDRLTYMENQWMKKVILSGNPSVDKENCVVMALFGRVYGCVGYCRLGDCKWTYLDNGFADVIYWKGVFYAVTNGGALYEFDLKDPCPVGKALLLSPVPWARNNQNYLAVSSGELLLVVRIYDVYTEEEFEDIAHFRGACHGPTERYNDDGCDDEEYCREYGEKENYWRAMRAEQERELDEIQDFEDADLDYEEPHYGDNFVDYEDADDLFGTTCFRFFKPNMESGTWTRVRNIRDQVLFVGINSSMSMDLKDFPECKANHVYFTNDQSSPSWWT